MKRDKRRITSLTHQLVVSSRNSPPSEAELQHSARDLTQCDERLQDPDAQFWQKTAYWIWSTPASNGRWASGEGWEERLSTWRRKLAVSSLQQVAATSGWKPWKALGHCSVFTRSVSLWGWSSASLYPLHLSSSLISAGSFTGSPRWPLSPNSP